MVTIGENSNYRYIDGDKISMSGIFFNVSVEVCHTEEYTYYVLIFDDDNIEKLTIKFYLLEDAIGFGIYAVRNCFMYYDIAMAYKDQCIAGKFKTLEELKEKTKQKVKK